MFIDPVFSRIYTVYLVGICTKHIYLRCESRERFSIDFCERKKRVFIVLKFNKKINNSFVRESIDSESHLSLRVKIARITVLKKKKQRKIDNVNAQVYATEVRRVNSYD